MSYCVTGSANDRAPPPTPLALPAPRSSSGVYLDATLGSLQRSISGVWHADVLAESSNDDAPPTAEADARDDGESGTPARDDDDDESTYFCERTGEWLERE